MFDINETFEQFDIIELSVWWINTRSYMVFLGASKGGRIILGP